MWKRLKESASGISTDFFTNLFRRRNYEQFEDDENAESERLFGARKYSDVRDEENNRVYWRKEVRSCATSAPADTDDGFTSSTLVTYQNEPGELRRREIQRFGDVSPGGEGYGGDEVKDIRPREFGSHNYGENRSLPPSQRLSEGVGELLHSHNHGRYERLDDFEDEICDYDEVTMDTRPESNVFHSIKDIDPKWDKTSKSRRRRKKFAKRTRRAVRRSWKFIKRGFTGYAASIPNVNLFFVMHTRK